MKPLFFAVLILFTLLSQQLFAGIITLNNGDVIHGELKALNENHVVWNSDVFGEISIPKSKIKQLNSSSVLPIVKTIASTENTVEKANCSIDIKNGARNDEKNNASAHCDSGKWQALSLNDIVSVPLAPKPAPFVGEIKFGYNEKSGNTDSEELDIVTSLEWRQKKFLHEAELSIESETSDGDVEDEQYKVNYQLNYDLNEDWFSYGRIKYEKTRFSAIDEQYQVGLGLGHRLDFTNQLQLNMQFGAAYLSSERTDGSPDDEDIAGRWALKLNWPIPGSELSLFHRQELLWVLDDIDNNEIETSTGIKMPLLGGIFSEIRYDLDYVSEPTNDQQHADRELVISLGYHW